MSEWVPYTEEQRVASNRYSSIKSRVTYNLEEHCSREDFISWVCQQS